MLSKTLIYETFEKCRKGWLFYHVCIQLKVLHGPLKTSGSANGMQENSWAGVTGIYFSAIYEKFKVQRGKSKTCLTNNYA